MIKRRILERHLRGHCFFSLYLCGKCLWVPVPGLTIVKNINCSYSHKPSQAAAEPLQLTEYRSKCTGLLKSTLQQQADVTEHCTVNFSRHLGTALQIRCFVNCSTSRVWQKSAVLLYSNVYWIDTSYGITMLKYAFWTSISKCEVRCMSKSIRSDHNLILVQPHYDPQVNR